MQNRVVAVVSLKQLLTGMCCVAVTCVTQKVVWGCVWLCRAGCVWLCVDQLGSDGECVHLVNHALGFVVVAFETFSYQVAYRVTV